jgi:hypothetical protein
MNNIPFLELEHDLGVRLTRILTIINVMGFNNAGNPTLTSEKITIFDFLTRYPYILKAILSENSKKEIVLYGSEVKSIQSQFPNSISLFEYGNIGGYLSLLTAYNHVSKTDKGKQSYYTITSEGNEFIDRIETTYIIKLTEICEAMSSIKNYTAARLIKKVMPLIEGV